MKLTFAAAGLLGAAGAASVVLAAPVSADTSATCSPTPECTVTGPIAMGVVDDVPGPVVGTIDALLGVPTNGYVQEAFVDPGPVGFIREALTGIEPGMPGNEGGWDSFHESGFGPTPTDDEDDS